MRPIKDIKKEYENSQQGASAESNNSSFGVRFCTIFLVEGSPQLDFRRNLPASDLFGLVTHS
ncbi:MAG: hypothetical protein P8X89_23855, partial [Reinekea sp.]